mmetsp:Transcript_5588/g.11046  ORF Transcript_5588/g.11046 Transcript_5588/m.11046 type:complete len:102 (+) Transcript_5588:162-467(+)
MNNTSTTAHEGASQKTEKSATKQQKFQKNKTNTYKKNQKKSTVGAGERESTETTHTNEAKRHRHYVNPNEPRSQSRHGQIGIQNGHFGTEETLDPADAATT